MASDDFEANREQLTQAQADPVLQNIRLDQRQQCIQISNSCA